MVEHEPDVYADAGYLLNEGGGIMSRPNGHKFYGVSITEKTPLWLALDRQRSGGHAAVPPPQTSVTEADRGTGSYRGLPFADPRVRPGARLFSARWASSTAVRLRIRSICGRVAATRTSRIKFLAVPRQNALVRDTLYARPCSMAATRPISFRRTASAEIDCAAAARRESPAGHRGLAQADRRRWHQDRRDVSIFPRSRPRVNPS